MRRLTLFALICAPVALAETQIQNDTWADHQHQNVRSTIKQWAHNMDDWFGTPDPNQPASANLRIMLDTNWNRYDDVRVKPRVRGRLKLPVLERKLSVVFGDDSLDNEILNNSQTEANPANLYDNQKVFNKSNSRTENSSIALRWSNLSKNLGVDTDADIGIRSGDDLYVRLKAGKTWQHGQNYSTTVEQMYRYGIDSEHYARTSAEIKKTEDAQTFIANYLHADYEHRGDDEGWNWGNSLYRQHNFNGNRRLNYGIRAGGAINGDGHKLNSYGVFAGWRQPIWRDWLFWQTEISYANNRDEYRKHYPHLFTRFEAIF